jgi:hypothetical protein
MQRNLQPWITTGIVLAGASLIAVTPVAPPAPSVQQRALKLVDYTEYDASQLTSATEANWQGLESILGSSNWTTDPDISQGLSTLFSDLSTGTSNAVTNPASLLTEGALLLTSSDDAFNAASTALTAVTDNIESALSGGDYSAALTDFEDAGTTVLYAFLNGYPETVGSGGLISPEFGLLTNTADGAATGQIDSLAQVSNTIADEVANLGGANLTTGSLPLVTGNLDLSVSLDQILSDLGLTSGGSDLTINGLLGDLGLPSSFSISDILSLLGVSDSTGFTFGQILSDLGLSDSSGISLGSALSDLGVTGSSGLSIDQILAALGLVTENSDGTYSDPTFGLESILGDLGVTPSTSISLDSILTDLGINPTQGIGIDTILTDLGIPSGDITLGVPSISIPIDTILSDLGLGGSINFGTLVSDLVGNPSYTINLGSYLGHSFSTTISLSSFLNDVGVGGDTISASSILSALGLTNTSGDLTFSVPSLSVSVSTILNDLGLGSDPTISVNTILSDLGLSNTDPSFSVSTILGDLGITSSSTIDLDSILNDLGISPTASIDLSSILSALGLSSSDTINIGDILNALGLSDSTQAITIGDALNFLGLSDSSSINIDSILSDLGINPNEDIFSLLGISDPLTLNPTIDLDGTPVATYFQDLSQDLLAALGSIAPLSSDLPSLLGPDPTLNVEPLLSSLLTDLGVPASLDGTLSLDLTNIAAELLPTLF